MDDSPFTGDGLSSFDLRFSGRGGRKAVGDVDGVFELVVLLELLDDKVVDDAAVVELVVVVVVAAPVVVTARPPRPFAPFRNLECTCKMKYVRKVLDDNVSKRSLSSSL